jgi:hypothetical protein
VKEVSTLITAVTLGRGNYKKVTYIDLSTAVG